MKAPLSLDTRRSALGTLVVAWAAFLAAISGTAFRVDEPNILAMARQIARAPLDPYGFRINWVGTMQPAWEVLANPPLVPAYLAGWARLFGWSEVSLHLAMIPFSIIAVLAVASLARSFGISPVTAMLLTVASPSVVLGSQVVMPDVAMLACVTAAVAAAVRIDDGRRFALLASVAAFVAPLVKYNGILVAAVLLALAIERRRPAIFGIALMPVLSLALWSAIGWLQYGSPHILALRSLQSGAINPLPGMIAAFGLGVLPVAIAFGGRLDRFRASAAAMVGAAGALVALRLLDYPAGSSVLYGVACGATTLFVLHARGNAMLWTWLLAPVVMQFGQRFTSVRYLIAMLPAAVLLWRPGGRWRVAMTAIASAALAVGLSIADAQTANLYRTFVRAHPTPRYSGHWGLQWYAEQVGARPVSEGERIDEPTLIAMHAFPSVTAPGATFPMTIASPLRTIDCAAAANFYGNAVANCIHYPVYLPFGFSRGEVETFVIASRTPAAANRQPLPASNAKAGTEGSR